MKTKIIITTMFFSSLTYLSFAQEKNREYKWGIGVQVCNPINDIKTGYFDLPNSSVDGASEKNKSYALGISIIRKLKKEIYFRFRMGYTKINVDRYDDFISFGTHVIGNSYFKQRELHFIPGAIRVLNKNMLGFYAGFEIPIKFHDTMMYDFNEVATDTNGSVLYKDETHSKIPGGMSYGMAAIMGFNFNITQTLSLGAEINPTLLYNKLGGTIITSVTDTTYPPPYPTITTTTIDKTEGVSQQIRFSFSINYSF